MRTSSAAVRAATALCLLLALIRCGTVFHSSESQATDMRYAGTFGTQAPLLAGLDSHVASDRVVALHANSWRNDDSTADQAVRHYEYRFLQPTGQQPLPTYDHAGGRDRLHGRAVWMSEDGSCYFLIATPTDGHLVGYRTTTMRSAPRSQSSRRGGAGSARALATAAP